MTSKTILSVIFSILLIGSLSAVSMVYADFVSTTIPVGDLPKGIATNPETNKIYVSANSVSVIDGTNDTVIDTIPVGDLPWGIATNPETNKIYVANRDDDTVSVIDGATNTVIDTIPVGDLPWGIVTNPETNKIYVSNFRDDTVSVIDGFTNSVTNTIPVGDGPIEITTNPVTNKIYTANFRGDTVSIIDGTTNTVTNTVAVGDGPTGIAVNPTTNKIYVVNRDDDTVSVIDGTTNSVTNTISVGGFPKAITTNPTTNKIYVANLQGDTVSVIDGTTENVVVTIPVGDKPFGIAVNPTTNKIYVVNRDDDTVSVIDGTISIDTTPPTIGEISDITLEATSPNDIIVNYPLPTVTDDTDPNPTISCNPTSGSLFPLGTTTITCTSQDISENTSTAEFNVTVEDTTDPVIIVPADITLEAPADTTPANTGTASATDTVDPLPAISHSDVNSLDSQGFGTITRTWSATDASGNSASADQIITVADTTDPVIASHADVTAEATGPNGATVNYPLPTVTDDTDPNPTISCNPTSGSLFPIDTTTVICIAEDEFGNTSTASFVVTVIDPTFCNGMTIDQLISSGDYNVIDNRGGGALGDILTGTIFKDLILASDSGNTVFGKAGSDCIIGGAGNDAIHGDLGNDMLFGRDGNDILTGGFGSDEISGQFGNDTIKGNQGRDFLDGGAGDDTINGGFGKDTCISDGEDTTDPKRCEL